MLSPADTLALDPALLLRAQGLVADPWQRRFLLSPSRRLLLLCSRGAGKSRATSALALHTALFLHRSLTLLISRHRAGAEEPGRRRGAAGAPSLFATLAALVPVQLGEYDRSGLDACLRINNDYRYR